MRGEKKLFLKRRSIRLHLRSLRSMRKRKARRRLSLYRSRECQIRINERREQKSRFSHYHWVKAPRILSIRENTEDSLAFIKEIDNAFSSNKPVFINIERVSEISQDTIVIMLSILIKFRSRGLPFNGNFPVDTLAREILTKSGFFKHLYKKRVSPQETYSISGTICTHAAKVVDSGLSARIIETASECLWKEQRRCPGVQRTFIELMQNTNNHASLTEEGAYHWWATMYPDPIDDKVSFAFIDYGVGIITSLQQKKKGKFSGMMDTIIQALGLKDNSDIIKALLDGKIHKNYSSKYNRGKGLPGVYASFQRKDISKLFIMTNNVKVDAENDDFICTKGELSGTFVYWELNKSTNNIK